MSVLIFFLILSVLVFVHELGHFLFAKWCGIRVDTFAIGFPPTLWQKKVGETDYKFNALPLGGYVSIYGENYETLDPTDKDFTRSFAIKKWWQQFAVLIAGILFNMVFAFVVLIVIGWMGTPTVVQDYYPEHNYHPEVSLGIASVTADSPAAQAEIIPGDTILSLHTTNDSLVLQESSLSIEALTETIQQGNPVTLEILQNKEVKTITITPEKGKGAEGLPGIGIGMVYAKTASEGVFGAFVGGWNRLIGMTTAVGSGLGSLITGNAHIQELTGPVGLTSVVADASKQGFATVLLLTAFISINLALLNLLPFPALDGGRIVFVIIEAITSKRIPAKVGTWVNGIGFILLMILMVVVTVQDVIKLF